MTSNQTREDDNIMDEIQEIEQKLAAMTPDQRAAAKARMRAAWVASDMELAERARQRSLDLVTERESAALAVIAACEAVKPLLAAFDQRDLALRSALPTLYSVQPSAFRWSLPAQYVGIDLNGARSQLDAFRHLAAESIAKT